VWWRRQFYFNPFITTRLLQAHEYLDPLEAFPHDGAGVFHMGGMASIDFRLFTGHGVI
jgi:hypothetical protein